MSPEANEPGPAPEFFINHSKADARLAGVFEGLLERVIPTAKIFLASTTGISAHWWTRYLEQMRRQLRTATHAFILLTPASLDLPWLTFEAGAITASDISRILPILYGLQPSDIPLPLAQFRLRRGDQREDIVRVLEELIRDTRAPSITLELDPIVRSYLDAVHHEVGNKPDAPNRRADKPSEVTSTVDDSDVRMLCELLFRLVVKLRERPEMLHDVDAAAFWAAVYKLRPSASNLDDLRALNAQLASEPAPGPLWTAWMRQVRSTDLAALVLHPGARRNPDDRLS